MRENSEVVIIYPDYIYIYIGDTLVLVGQFPHGSISWVPPGQKQKSGIPSGNQRWQFNMALYGFSSENKDVSGIILEHSSG